MAYDGRSRKPKSGGEPDFATSFETPDFATSFEIPDFATSFRLREATSGRPLYKMAALSVASRRLPGMTQRNVCPSRLFRAADANRPIELPHLETFPGAACYQPIELPCYKAAPLQAFGPLNDLIARRSYRADPHAAPKLSRTRTTTIF